MEYSIIEFFENSTFLNVKNLSPVQKMTLKAIMGDDLDTETPIPKAHPYQETGFANEVDMFKFFSGKGEYVPRFYSNPSLCFGRRSGKSTTIGAGLAIYFATQFDYTPYLGTSPHATIPIISPTKEQAGEVYSAIKSFFLQSPILFKDFLGGKVSAFQDEFSEEDVKDTRAFSGGNIKLTNKVVIKVMPADVAKIRGMAVPFAILDECCFFGVEGNDLKNTDKGIYEALSPALSQFKTVEGMAMVLKISSPNGQTGLMYEEYEDCKNTRVLHLQVPSWYANPTVSVNYLEEQQGKGISFFNREYGAQYTASETAYLDPNNVDRMIIRGIDKIEYLPQYRYVASMDYATKNDYWTFAIGHKEYFLEEGEEGVKIKKEKVQVDLLMHWKGEDGAELDPSEVIPELCMYMKAYRVGTCVADQYAFAALRPYFQKEGCQVKEFKLTSQSKMKCMYSLQVGINSGTLSMVHNPLAVKHLKDLREKRTTGTNTFKVEAAANCHDDYAIVVALTQYQFDKTSPIYIGTHKEDAPPGPPTKDARGKQLLTPSATELADFSGNPYFRDNRSEFEEKDPDDDDGSGFWFTF